MHLGARESAKLIAHVCFGYEYDSLAKSDCALYIVTTCTKVPCITNHRISAILVESLGHSAS